MEDGFPKEDFKINSFYWFSYQFVVKICTFSETDRKLWPTNFFCFEISFRFNSGKTFFSRDCKKFFFTAQNFCNLFSEKASLQTVHCLSVSFILYLSKTLFVLHWWKSCGGIEQQVFRHWDSSVEISFFDISAPIRWSSCS